MSTTKNTTAPRPARPFPSTGTSGQKWDWMWEAYCLADEANHEAGRDRWARQLRKLDRQATGNTEFCDNLGI